MRGRGGVGGEGRRAEWRCERGRGGRGVSWQQGVGWNPTVTPSPHTKANTGTPTPARMDGLMPRPPPPPAHTPASHRS